MFLICFIRIYIVCSYVSLVCISFWCYRIWSRNRPHQQNATAYTSNNDIVTIPIDNIRISHTQVTSDDRLPVAEEV